MVPDHWRGLLNLAVAQVGLKRTSEAQKNLRRAFKASGARMHDSPLPIRFPPIAKADAMRTGRPLKDLKDAEKPAPRLQGLRCAHCMAPPLHPCSTPRGSCRHGHKTGCGGGDQVVWRIAGLLRTCETQEDLWHASRAVLWLTKKNRMLCSRRQTQ